jgi:hypothetical protein
MALSAAKRYSMRDLNPLAINSYPVRTSAVIYYGALVGISTIGLTDGRLVNWSSGSGAIDFLGIAIPATDYVTGNAGGTVECPVMEGGCILENVAVTGLNSADDVGDMVYASDNATFSLTPTSNVSAVGQVTRYRSSGYGDVEILSKQAYLALDAGKGAV